MKSLRNLCLLSLLTLYLFFTTVVHAGFVSWLFGSNLEAKILETEKKSVPPSTTVLNSKTKFEMKLTDEKFLVEAQKLSPLDACQHVIIAQLRTSCSDLTEEEMGKVSVQLLNCQSETENRKTFPCTSEMTIAECTADMDAVTWNAYQIVSNRARAMCYTVKQQHFRMQTEQSVNRLVLSTEEQLSAMEKLEESQSNIQALHTSTVQRMVEGQQDLMARQEVLRSTQARISNFISNNLRELYKEKALIAAGHTELANLTEQIKVRLDNATGQLVNQGKEQRMNHAELLQDLAEIREKAKTVWDKIDESTRHIVHHQEETSRHYEEMVANLHRVNQSLVFMLSTIEEMRWGVMRHLDWLSDWVGGAGDQLAIVTTILHMGYFLLAAITATFLSTPCFTRLTLLIIVPVNAMTQVRHGSGFDFITMSVFIGLTVVVGWCYNLVSSVMSKPCAPVLCNFLLSPTKSPHNEDVVKRDDRSMSEETVTVVNDSYSTVADQSLLNVLPSLANFKAPPTPSRSSAITDSCTTETPVGNVRIHTPGTASTHAATPVPDVFSSFNGTDNKISVDQVRRHLLSTLSSTPRQLSPSTSRCSTPSRSSRSRMTPRPPCLATTKTGQPCKLGCVDGSDYCYRHQAN